MRSLLRWLRATQPTPAVSEEAAAAARWRVINDAARAAGCKCGAPATHVRYMHGTVGGVPAETHTCAEHVNVNGWSRAGAGPWVPTDDFSESALKWVSPARPVRRDAR